MSGVVVIVAYRPKPGKENELVDLVRSRVPTLRKEGLVTDRAPTMMRSRDGTIIEVSEWKSREAIDAAHKNPNVLAMWNKFFAICDCVRSKPWRKQKKCLPALSRWRTEL
jgi:quinol monooxygenase YgiN